MIRDRVEAQARGQRPPGESAHSSFADVRVNKLNPTSLSSQHHLACLEEQVLSDSRRLVLEGAGWQRRMSSLPRELQDLLWILDLRLPTIKQGTAYELAETLDRSYANDPNFRLMFLRANNYQPERAARQMIKFFDFKQKLFGRSKLVKDITLNDLDDDDRASLRSGFLQVRQPDIAGRKLIAELPGLRSFKRVENELRARFFLLMSELASKTEAQDHELGVVVYSIGQYKDHLNWSGCIENAKLSVAMPVPWRYVHFCFDDRKQFLDASGALRILQLELSEKVKCHYGPQEECILSLARYGILPSCLPLRRKDDTAILGDHLAWCSKFEELALSGKFDGPGLSSIEPTQHDVLFGSDKNHLGNAKFRSLIDHLQDQYEEADRDGKVKMSLIVVFSMKGTGSRFLNFDTRSMDWKEMTDAVARTRVTKIIRNRRRYRVSKKTGGSK